MSALTPGDQDNFGGEATEAKTTPATRAMNFRMGFSRAGAAHHRIVGHSAVGCQDVEPVSILYGPQPPN
jgi:hypothetical protein